MSSTVGAGVGGCGTRLICCFVASASSAFIESSNGTRCVRAASYPVQSFLALAASIVSARRLDSALALRYSSGRFGASSTAASGARRPVIRCIDSGGSSAYLPATGVPNISACGGALSRAASALSAASFCAACCSVSALTRSSS